MNKTNKLKNLIGNGNNFLIIPISAFTVLAVFFIALSTFNISTNQNVYAESSGAQASLIVDSVIDISAPPTVTLNCTPGSTDALAQLCTSTANVVVTTNNITGYTLQMNAANGSPTALINNTASPAATIPTLSQAYAPASFPVNYWGYTGGLDKSSETGGYNCSTNYCPILAYQSDASNYSPNHVIKVTDAPSNASTTPITFAGKVNTTKPSGTYSTSVTFTAVTNAIPTPTMQDFTASACANATTDQTFVLRDSRDDKEYNIAKLQDGNCWMTQNLDLGSNIAMTLTPADTDIASNFTLPASGWSESSDNPVLYDPGNLYWTGEICNEADPETGDPLCPSGHPYPPISSAGSQSYHLGNYYNWPAATAGSGTSATTSGDVQYSICPKNWHLPSAGTSSTTGNEFKPLFNHYITSSYMWADSGWYGFDHTEVTSAPLSLPLSGDMWGGDNFSDVGSEGGWWSSTGAPYGPYRVFFQYSETTDLNVRYSDGNDTFGHSVRCILDS